MKPDRTAHVLMAGGIQSLRQLSGHRDSEEGRTKSDYRAEEMVAEGVGSEAWDPHGGRS